MGNNAPCYKCQRRAPGCHGGCREYIEFKESVEKINHAIQERNSHVEYQISVNHRLKRMRGEKV